MSDVSRPLPNLEADPDTRAFWQATQSRALKYQQCENCRTIVFYPRAHCTGCVDGALQWHTSSGRGHVYTYSVIRQSYHPFFRTQVPYIVAWVDLEEGPRILCNITGVEDPDLQLIGQPVEVRWEAHENLEVPLFRWVG